MKQNILLVLAIQLPSLVSLTSLRRRIVEGEEVTEGSYPFACSFQYKSKYNQWKHACGSVIYSNSTLITAAHCVDGIQDKTHYNDERGLRVVCGTNNLEDEHDPYRVVRHVPKKISHPGFIYSADAGFPDDIGLLFLDRPLPLSAKVKPAHIPDEGEHFSSDCLLVGWGKTGQYASTSDVLKKLETRLISEPTCQLLWRDEEDDMEIGDTRLCFLNRRSPYGSACGGDSGGPAICGGKVVGVSSFGEITCTKRDYKPSVYTRIAAYHRWIAATARTNDVTEGNDVTPAAPTEDEHFNDNWLQWLRAMPTID